MKPTGPPSSLERLLLFLLPLRDREAVSGDLYEEFVDVKLPELGSFRACLWYLQQVLSFVPSKAEAVFLQAAALRLLCFFTALAGGWLGMMDLLLRQLGYVSQLSVSAAIVTEALLTICALRLDRYRALRVVAIAGSLPLLWLSGGALKATFGGVDFEGYVLLIASSLILQVLLTVLTLTKRGHRRKEAHDHL